MPTLPMYRQNVSAPRWRGIFLPGGYEFFEINLGDTRLRIGIGNPYSQEYRRRDRRYRRWPTRFWPALPAEFPFASLEQAGRRRLVNGQGMKIDWDEVPSIRLGPAEIVWSGEKIRASWTDDAINLRLGAEACGPMSIETNAPGIVRERRPIRRDPPEGADGWIAHEFGPHHIPTD
jgi:hypothetical protein